MAETGKQNSRKKFHLPATHFYDRLKPGPVAAYRGSIIDRKRLKMVIEQFFLPEMISFEQAELVLRHGMIQKHPSRENMSTNLYQIYAH